MRILARAMIAREQSIDAVVLRLTETLGRAWRWIPPLARRYLKAFPATRTRPRHRSVVKFLLQDAPFSRACRRHRLKLAQWTTAQQQMLPVPVARVWQLPPIETVAALADWLRLNPTELEWFADRRHLNGRQAAAGNSPLAHYHYRILTKAHGTPRLIEIPKPRLKLLQRQILREILDRIPLHEAAHGFCAGRSILTFTAPHVGQEVILRMDLRDFFPSFSAARVQAFFRTAGYPETVADLLTGICTNVTPRGVWKPARARYGVGAINDIVALHARAHLPQGAPTSPALANAMTYRIDCRLAAFAEAAGARYTRYADDLAFSGDRAFANRAERFAVHVDTLLQDEGFAVHHRKTRIMPQGVRQHLAGVVVNSHPNMPRPDFDTLKAILTNCLRHGAASQNRDGHTDLRRHLEGRVTFVEMVNPAKAARLRRLFDQIEWS